MLDTDSTIQVSDPNLNDKTDSVFYTVGILKGMQQLADQYVLTNEMRGDLVKTTEYTTTALRQLANFSATTSNKYDSAYVYYKVINNCNYYIANRDTALMTGSRKVAMNEYVEAKAIRAWAYLQLAKTYGKVPFYTTPITSIAGVNATYPEYDIKGICDALAPDLAQYTGYAVPYFGTGINAGSLNSTGSKTFSSKLCMIPVDVILGDLYLEAAGSDMSYYTNAAKYYFNYLKNNNITISRWYFAGSADYAMEHIDELPSDFVLYTTSPTWFSIFTLNNTNDIVTYIPMAVNKLNGTTTELPGLFGYEFYATTSGTYSFKPQIMPSDSYFALNNSQDYYYPSSSSTAGNIVKALSTGDMRRYAIILTTSRNDTVFNWVKKFNNANINLYRYPTVYLHLGEALNRLGYPDAAFAILKDGLKTSMGADTTYMTTATKKYLTETLPFFSEDNENIFAEDTKTNKTICGIHGRGTYDCNGKFSPYQMDTMVSKKFSEYYAKYNIKIDSTNATKADTINAVEDMICDEYALETAFEGSRFGDLCRMARRKNASSPTSYGSNFGGVWLAEKLELKNPSVDLKSEKNWYLPFK